MANQGGYGMEPKAKHKVSVSDALAFIFQWGYFGRSEYVIPTETQLTIEAADAAFGNTDGFDNETYYTGMKDLPCFDGTSDEEIRETLSHRYFHIPCGKTDIPLTALESIYELRQKFGIRKFLLLTSDATERELLSRTISVMQDHFSDKYYGLKLNLMLYDSDNPKQLRSYALSDDIQLLVVNKEYFIRSNNRLKRPCSRLDGLSPAAMLRPARCVAITISDTLKEVRTVLRHASVFDPLCTISFTKTDASLDDPKTVKISDFQPLDIPASADEQADDWGNFHIHI